MTQPLHSQPTYQGIRHRVQTLTRDDGGEVTPPLPPNDVPHPAALRNSAVYYPLLPSVATAQLNYLHHSLAHPSVTGPESFHAVVVTANYALRLEPEVFRGQRVQRTHMYNATLAELQGPDGIPISTRIGHAILFFFPGELDPCSDTEETASNRGEVRRNSDRDEEGEGSGILVQSQRSADDDQEMEEDERPGGTTQRRHTYPPDSPPLATIDIDRTMSLPFTMEEGEIWENKPPSNGVIQSLMCRVVPDLTASKPNVPPLPRKVPTVRLPPPSHSALLASFVLPVQQIISVKHDEARGVFRVPRDYTLRMRVDEAELRDWLRGLAADEAVRLDFVVRTLVRVSNERGSALILHNPVYLDNIHQLLYPRRVDPYMPKNAETKSTIPRFKASIFELETCHQQEEEGVSSESEEEEAGKPGSKREGLVERTEGSEREVPLCKKRRVGPYTKGDKDPEISPLPLALNTAVRATDSCFPCPRPVPSLLFRPPTPFPNLRTDILLEDEAVDAGRRSVLKDSKVFLAQLEDPPLPIAGSNQERGSERPKSFDASRLMAPEGLCQSRDTVELDKEERDKWEIGCKQTHSPAPKRPALIIDTGLPMAVTGPPSDFTIASTPPSSPVHGRLPPIHTFTESPTAMSGYESSGSSSPSSSSTDSSMPSLTSDDSDAYSSLSLDELRRGSMKSTRFVVEPVRLSRETKAALDDLPNEPRYFVCRTSEANEHGRNSALTYITRQHEDEWRASYEFVPTDNGPVSPHPFSMAGNQFVYQLVETFQGTPDNSPLRKEFNTLVNPFNPTYDSLRGLDEYKIATLALKVYDLIMDLDIRLEHWKDGHSKLSQHDLDSIRLTVFRARAERNRLIDIGEWGHHLRMQGMAESPAATRITDCGTHEEGDIQTPNPRAVIFLKPGEVISGMEHVAYAARHPQALETYKPLDNDPAYSFLDAKLSSLPEVYKNPWIPLLTHIRITRLCIHRFFGLICKQFFTTQWRRAVDRLSPRDEARHFLYWHNDCFRYLDPSFPTYLQGFNHKCIHVDHETGGVRTANTPRNPLFTVNEDEFLYHAASLFEFEGRGELANCIRYARAAEPMLSQEVRTLFAQGYVEPIDYYDKEGRHRAFRGDELDLHYYDEVD